MWVIKKVVKDKESFGKLLDIGEYKKYIVKEYPAEKEICIEKFPIEEMNSIMEEILIHKKAVIDCETNNIRYISENQQVINLIFIPKITKLGVFKYAFPDLKNIKFCDTKEQKIKAFVEICSIKDRHLREAFEICYEMEKITYEKLIDLLNLKYPELTKNQLDYKLRVRFKIWKMQNEQSIEKISKIVKFTLTDLFKIFKLMIKY